MNKEQIQAILRLQGIEVRSPFAWTERCYLYSKGRYWVAELWEETDWDSAYRVKTKPLENLEDVSYYEEWVKLGYPLP